MAENKIRLIFCGNGYFGTKILNIIAADPQLQISVFIKKTEKKDKWRLVVEGICKQHNLQIITTDSINGKMFAQQADKACMIFICCFGELIQPILLKKYLFVNLHPSLLPKYRGATPVYSALLNGEKIFGISLMKIDKHLDAGDLYLRKVISINERIPTLQSVYLAIIKECTENLGKWIADISNKKLVSNITQNHATATYCWKFRRCFNEINPACQSASKVTQRINAMVYHRKPFLIISGAKIIIYKLEQNYKIDTFENKTSPGEIIEFTPSGLVIKCTEGAIKITKMQLSGRGIQNAADFYNGYRYKFKLKVK